MATLFPNGGRALVEAMCAKFPDLHVNEDEKQRELTERINQQMKYQFGQGWGGKVRAGLDPVQFRSKDSQAFLETDGTISVWDLFQGNADVTILVQDGAEPDHPHLSPDEAYFIDVIARDWLAGSVPEPGTPVPEPGTDLESRVAELEAEVAAQDEDIAALFARVADLEVVVSAIRAELAKPMKVVGPTTSAGASFLKHWHDVNLTVHRVG
jgi:uncharacterized coiled-coil protein SlyX